MKQKTTLLKTIFAFFIFALFSLQKINAQVTLNLKLFIEGYYSGNGLMNNNGAGGCLYVTGHSLSQLDADTIIVELYDTTNLAIVYASEKVILHTDGTCQVFFPTASIGGTYTITVRHRNALATSSMYSVTFTGAAASYDFTTSINQACGNNMADVGTPLGEPPVWAFFSGDISDASTAQLGVQDGVIESQDFSDIENAAFGSLAGYVYEDLTGNGIVDDLDSIIVYNNISIGAQSGCNTPQVISTLQLKLFIEGYYTGNGMMDNYGQGGCLFVTGISSSPFDSDSITVELRDPANQSILIASTKTIMHTDGTCQVYFPSSIIGHSYIITVQHRNALTTCSALPVAFTGTITSYDFTTSSSQAGGNNMIDVGTPFGGSSAWAFFSGDVNDDCIINSTDSTIVADDVYIINMGYVTTDLSGDGFVDSYDYSLVENNSHFLRHSTCNCAPTLVVDAGPDQIICAGSSVALTASAGSSGGPFTYQWNTGSTTATIVETPNTNTIYTVTVTDNNGITATDQVIVTVIPLPPAPTASNSIQCGYGIPTAAVTGTGGTFNWYMDPTGGNPIAGETQSTLIQTPVSQTTTFYVSEFDGTCEGPRAIVIAFVVQPDPITAFYSSVCTPITLTVVQTGSTNTYSYIWTASPSQGSGITGSISGGTINVSPTASGTYIYTVTGTDASSGCVTISTVTYTDNTDDGNPCTADYCDPATGTITHLDTCPVFNIACPSDIFICFNFPDADIDLGDPMVTGANGIVVINNNAPSTYPVGTTEVTWTASDSTGHSSTCIQHVVRNAEVNSIVQFTTIPASQSNIIHVCLGQPVYFLDQSSGITSWNWDFGDGYLSTENNPVHPYYFSGTFTVTLTAANDCHVSTILTAVVQVDPESGPDIYCPSVVCAFDTVVYSTSVVCSQYVWTVSGGTIISSPVNSNSIMVAWGDGSSGDGTITLDIPGCANLCNRPSIRLIPIIPSTLTVSGITIVCTGNTSSYSVPCIPGTTYDWIVGSQGTIINGQGTHEITIYWTSGMIGTATIDVNYQNNLAGCSGIGTLNVMVLPILGISGPGKLCPNIANTSSPFNAINTTTLAGANADWTVITPANATLSNLQTNSSVFDNYNWNAGPGIYMVIANVQPGAFCNFTVSTTVEVVDQLPAPGTITGPIVVCPNSTNNYTVTPNMTNVNYLWTITGGTPAAASGSNVSITWGASVPYSISVKQQLSNSPYCLSNETTLTVTQYPPIVLPTVTGPVVVCRKNISTYSFAGVPNPDAVYTWSIDPSNAGSIASVNGTSSIMIDWNGTNNTTTNASVKLTIEFCGSHVIDYPVLVNALPEPGIEAPSVICINQSAQFNDPAGIGTWLWDFGDPASGNGNHSTLQNPVHSYSHSGNYTVTLTVTNGNNCTGSAVSNIIVNDKPETPVITGAAPVCSNSSSTYSFAQAMLPGAVYQWSVSPISAGSISSSNNSNSISVQWNSSTSTVSANIILNVTSACLNTQLSFPVTINPLPQPIITSGSPACINTALSFNGSTGSSWLWDFGDPLSGGNNTSTIQNPYHSYSQSGSYTVSLNVTDGNNCSSTAVSNITVADKAEIPIITGVSPVCANGISAYSFGQPMFSGADYKWSISPVSAGSITSPDNSNSITVQWNSLLVVTNANIILDVTSACLNSHQIFPVTVNPIPQVVITPGSPACINSSLAFSSSNAISWLWDFGDTSSGINNNSTQQNPSHTYNSVGTKTVQLSLIDGNGCSSNSSAIVNINPLPQASISTGDPIEFCLSTSVSAALIALSGPGYIYNWIGGGTSNITTPNRRDVTSLGTYSVVVQNSYGCTKSSNSITLIQKTCPQVCVPDFGFTSIINCDLASFTQTGASPVNLLWEFGDGTSATAINTSHSYNLPGLYQVKLSGPGTLNLSGNLCDTSITQTIEIPIKADFFSEFECTTTGLVLTNLIDNSVSSKDNTINTWEWYLDGNTTTVPDYTTQNVFSIPMTPGVHTIRLVIKTVTNKICSVEKNILVVSPIILPTVTGPSIVCKKNISTYSFTDPLIPNATYTWSIDPANAGSISSANGSSNITIDWTGIDNSPVNAIVKLTVSICGDHVVDYPVTVNALPEPVITTSTPVCVNTQLSLSGSAGSSWLWNFGDPTLVNNSSTLQNPTHTYSDTGEVTIQLTVTNANGCFASTFLTIEINPLPVASISTGDPTTYCPPIMVAATLYAVNGPGYSYSWSGGGTSNISADQRELTALGSYSVVVQNSFGCSRMSNIITLSQGGCGGTGIVCNPDFDFTSTVNCDAATFTQVAAIPSNLTWNFGDFSSATAVNTSHTYNLPGFYSVSLTGPGTQSPGGGPCITSVYHTIEIPIKADFNYKLKCFTGGFVQTDLFDKTLFFNGHIINSWEWYIGASTTPDYTGQNISNAQLPLGMNTIKLVVTSVTNKTCIIIKNIFVSDPLTIPTITGSAIVCSKDLSAYSFADPLNPDATYTWSVDPASAGSIASGNGTSSVTVNWSSTNTQVNAVVKLTITLCGDHIVNYPVVVNPVPQPVITPGSPACINSSLSFTSQAGSSWLWDFGDPSSGAINSSTLQNPSHLYNSTGTKYVFLTFTDGNGCSAKTFETVNIKPLPIASITTSDSVKFCQFSNVAATLHALIGQGYTYNWIGGGTSNISTPYQREVTSLGSYSVVVQNSYGCTSTSNTITLIQKTCPQVCVPDFNFTYSADCDVVTFTQTGTNPTNLLWDFGDGTTASAINTNHTYSLPGFYQVKLSGHGTLNPGGGTCDTVIAHIIEIVTKADFYYLFKCSAGGVVLADLIDISVASGNNIISSWEWYDGLTLIPSSGSDALNIPLSPGVHSIKLVITSGSNICSVIKNITVPDPITADFTYSSLLCQGALITFNDNSSMPVISRLWDFNNNGTSTSTASSPGYNYLTSGTKTVKYAVTDNIGCTSFVIKSFDILPSGAGSISPSGPINICFGESVVLNAPPGGSSYEWSTAAHDVTQSITVTESGNYSVKVTGSNGCSYTTPSAAVNVNPIPQADISGKHTYCSGESLYLNTSSGSFNYVWEFDDLPIDGNYSTVGGSTSSLQFIVNNSSASGNYRVIIANTATLCSDTSLPYPVTVYDVPANPVITASGPIVFCVGGSVTLTAPSGAIYDWSTQEATQAITVTQSGTFSVVIKTSDGCPFYPPMIQVTVNPLPQAIVSGKQTYCPGESLNLNTPSGLYSYAWEFDNIPINGIYTSTGGNSSSLQNIVNSSSASGNYRVAVTNTSTLCEAVSIPYSVIVYDVPTNPVITASGPVEFCDGDSVTLTAPAGASYKWSTNSLTQEITTTQSGTFSVVVTTVDGCTYSPPAVAVTNNPRPPALIQGRNVYCELETMELQSVSGYSYQWSFDDAPVNNSYVNVGIDNSILHIENIASSMSGNYKVVVTIPSTGCSAASIAYPVIVNPVPEIPNVSANAPIPLCEGQQFLLTIDNPESNVIYEWNTGQSGLSIPAANADEYFVTAKNQFGCSSVSNIVVINPTPDLSCVPSGCFQLCDSMLPFTVTGPSGYSNYQWQISGTFGFTTVATTKDLTVTANGIYRLVVTNSFGCFAESQTLELNFIPCGNCALTAAISAYSNVSCHGGNNGTATITLSGGTGPYAFKWSNGETDSTAIHLAAGYATSIVRDAFGCIDTVSIGITEPLTALTAFATQGTILCHDSSTSVTVTCTGGTPIYSGTGTFNRKAGPYTYTVTDFNNCTATVTGIIYEPPMLTVTASADTILCHGDTTHVIVTAGGGTGLYTGTGIFIVHARTYNYTVTDANGCPAATSVTVSEPPVLTESVTAGTIACYGDTTCIHVNANGGTPSYNGTGNFCGYGSGTWTFTVTDHNNCSVDTTIIINEPAKLTTTTMITQSGCSGNTGTATAHPSGGIPVYSYHWMPGNLSTQTITGLNTGTYLVTVTDSHGCTSTASAVITNSGGGNPSCPGPISGPSAVCCGQCITYSINPVQGATSYIWTKPNGTTGTSNGTSITICFNNNFCGGLICVKAVNSCGTSQNICKNISKVTSVPSTCASITGSAARCQNTSGTYSISAIANATSYVWSTTGGLIIVSGQGTNSILVSAPAGFLSGTIKVYARNCLGNGGTRVKNISGNPKTPVFINCSPSSVCAGGCYPFEVQNYGDAATWTFTGPPGSTITMVGVSGSGNPKTGAKSKATICLPAGFVSGNVTVYATNSCGNSSISTLAIRSAPAAPASISGPLTGVCNTVGNVYSISAVTGATSYTWTIPNGAQITSNTGTCITVKFLSSFVSGNICVKANNSCGSSDQTCLAINAKPAAPGSISGSSPVCKTQVNVPYSVTSIAGATSYSWTISGGAQITYGAGTNSIKVKFTTAASNTVTLSVTANNSCGSSSASSKTITVNFNCRTSEEDIAAFEESFSLYPNPTTGKTTITFYSNKNAYSLLKVFDLIGREILTENISAVEGYNQMELDFENITNGCYVISIQEEGGKARVKRLIVEH